MRESSQSWRDLLLNVRRPGLTTGPQIAVADGALGFWKALGEVWPSVDAAHAGDAGFAPENQVRTRLPAGGKEIRTLGPPAKAELGAVSAAAMQPETSQADACQQPSSFAGGHAFSDHTKKQESG